MTSGSRDLLRLHRVEYPIPVHYLCYASWGACYAVGGLRQLLTAPVLLAVAANLVLPAAMSVLNAAVDVRGDALNRGKADLAEATLRVGVRSATIVTAVEMGLAQMLAIVASLVARDATTAVVVAVIIVLHVLYNAEPVRLKRRGFANPLTLGVSLGLLPCLATFTVVRPDIAPATWLIFAGLSTSITGRALWWMVPDREADAAAGTVTVAVRHGAARAVTVSCFIAATVPVLLGWGLWWRYGPAVALPGIVVSGAFLAGQLSLLRRDRPSYARIRKATMAPMTIATVFFTVLPLVALS
ncbi:MAG: UbiA prenyltransferase family protein [Kutzneria sp.]|nr:UbiA prenyltransferase family protein [Kutzneria sp.]